MESYVPPKVWTWEKANGGQFANINRPVAGPTHDKELPVGGHALQLYSLATPNGVKVTVLLEELLELGHAGAEYDAPTKMKYPIDRFAMETKRQLDVLDRHLAERAYMAGDEYSIADMAIWPWYGALVKGLAYEAAEFLQVHEYTHVIRWTDHVAARPAVQRGRRVNRVWGEPSSHMPERHSAADFAKAEAADFAKAEAADFAKAEAAEAP